MNYRKLGTAELNKYKYPNLVAEIMESGYSICTLSEHMGYGRCKEDDSLIRAKVFGDGEISFTECVALVRLFACDFEYLFAEELRVEEGRPMAFYRHYEMNRQLERDSEIYRLAERLRERMRKEEGFLEFMKVMAEVDMEDVRFEKRQEATE